MAAPSARFLLRPRWQILCRLGGRSLTRSYASLDTEAHCDAQLHDWTPSELLRAALTARTKGVADNEPTSSLYKQVFELLDREWKLGSPPPALWCALKGVYPMYRTEDNQPLRQVSDLSALRRVAEKLVIDEDGAAQLQGRHCRTLGHALQRCERHSTYTEILSTLSDIITRLQRYKLSIRPQIFELAMCYAVLDLSASALGPLLQGYDKVVSSEFISGTGGPVLKALLGAIESAALDNLQYNTKLLLAELTGEGKAAPQSRPTLHGMLLGTPDRDRQNWSMYLCIMAKLQSEQTLQALWKQYLKVLNDGDENTYHSAYNVVIALIQARRSNTAVNFLEDISQRSGDTLPHIATLHNLQPLIDDPIVGEALPDLVQGDHYEQLLESRLEDIEQRLGIRWQGTQQLEERNAHFSITPDSSWAIFQDQPLLTIDGNSAGYDDPARLYPELRARGCSKSVDDLGHLVNLLNEQDGNAQEIVIHLNFNRRRLHGLHTQLPSLELRWCPEHSPIEFADSPVSALSKQPQEWTPASLGLIRARSMINGVPQAGTRCLHLLQLGSLDMRHGPSEPWQPSGYIVAWDRQHGEMIALFVGKNYGLIDRGPTPPGAPFGAVRHINPSIMPDVLPLSLHRLPRDPEGPYYLDLDPSTDLGFS